MFRRPPWWAVRFSGGRALVAQAVLWLLGTAAFIWRADWLGFSSELPDARFLGYDVAALFAFFEPLGAQNRRWYALTQLTLDVAYPAVYSCLLGALILRASGPRGGSLAWLPAFAGAADLVENALLAVLAVWGDRSMSGLVAVASFFTTLKWLLVAMSVIALVLGVLLWLWDRTRTTRPREQPSR